MSLFFPDLNVWLALSVAGHSHSSESWKWLRTLPDGSKLIFSRYTQVGLLRLLTNNAVMGGQTLVLRKAWEVYERWLDDPRVEFFPEPRNIDAIFRRATEPHSNKQASKWVGDCWLLAFAIGTQATLVTFDRALSEFAQKEGHPAIIPG